LERPLSNKKNDKRNQGTFKRIFIVFICTFFCATGISLLTTTAVERLTVVPLLFLVLLIVVAIGVFFDAIGVAALGADIVPFNARSSRKAPGAAVTLRLLRKADLVANICCDVVGDICGIVSGALGATLVVILGDTVTNTLLLAAVMAGLVSAFTVGGKAMMKGVAVRNADRIMEIIGVVLDFRNWGRFLTKNNRSEGDSR
jgi:CBS domain containing-hemolysin-like protein